LIFLEFFDTQGHKIVSKKWI